MDIDGHIKVAGNITLADNASSEVRNVYLERVNSIEEETMAASLGLPHFGRVVFNLTSGALRIWDGGAFQTVGGNSIQFQAQLDSHAASIAALTTTIDGLTPRVEANEITIQTVTTSVGLDGSGILQPISGSSYLDGTSVVMTGLLTLDNKLKEVEDSISTAQFTQEFADVDLITVTHNKGKKYVSVIVVDNADQQIIPQSISYVDANSLVILLSAAAIGTVIVS